VYPLSLRVLIDIPSLAPVARPYYSDPSPAVSESHCHDAFPNFAEAVVPLLGLAVVYILCDHPIRIRERILDQAERDSVFRLVLPVLPLVPLKAGSSHGGILANEMKKSNTKSHIAIWLWSLVRVTKCEVRPGLSHREEPRCLA